MSEVAGPYPLIPPRSRPAQTGSVLITNTTAMRHSAVWACLMLRAGLISTFPVDVLREVTIGSDTILVEVPKPPVFRAPGGEHWLWPDWCHASQVDLDRAGNTIGLIIARDGFNVPSEIELAAIDSCTVIRKAHTGEIRYRIDGKEYTADKVWHERSYPVAGLPVGLSPVAFAAYTIGEYLSMQEFALSWFAGSGVPKAKLKDTGRSKVEPKEAGIIRDRWRAAIHDGDLFVHGKDWEYQMIQANTAGTEFIEGRRFGLADVARFFGCPADLIDAAISAPGSLTYANITQRNLQFLIMQLGPAVIRREAKWTAHLVAQPRIVKLNTSALLRLDPVTQGHLFNAAIAGRRITVSEVRGLENRPPLTPEQEDEFKRLFGEPVAKVPSNVPPKLSPNEGGQLSTEEVGMLERAFDQQMAPLRATLTVERDEQLAIGGRIS
jgi:HK97 family phage portal protein